MFLLEWSTVWVCVCVGGSMVCVCVCPAVWEMRQRGSFLWGVALSVCFLCPFQPFFLKPRLTIGRSQITLFSEYVISEECLRMQCVWCWGGGGQGWWELLGVCLTKCLTYSNYCCICYNCRGPWDSPDRFHMRKISGYLRPSTPGEKDKEREGGRKKRMLQ